MKMLKKLIYNFKLLFDIGDNNYTVESEKLKLLTVEKLTDIFRKDGVYVRKFKPNDNDNIVAYEANLCRMVRNDFRIDTETLYTIVVIAENGVRRLYLFLGNSFYDNVELRTENNLKLTCEFPLNVGDLSFIGVENLVIEFEKSSKVFSRCFVTNVIDDIKTKKSNHDLYKKCKKASKLSTIKLNKVK